MKYMKYNWKDKIKDKMTLRDLTGLFMSKEKIAFLKCKSSKEINDLYKSYGCGEMKWKVMGK